LEKKKHIPAASTGPKFQSQIVGFFFLASCARDSMLTTFYIDIKIELLDHDGEMKTEEKPKFSQN